MFIKANCWVPHRDFKATSDEIHNVLLYTNQWCKNKFHKYIKTVESQLLSNFRNMMNNCHISISKPNWDLIKKRWRKLALFRDFHDYMCGRDRKHYIRTDDCRRFVLGITKGLESNEFIKPVHRLLNGENAPRKFIHPLFIDFN
jgi:hypothetical protein